MEDQEARQSCWGVATWAVVIFLGAFAVVSLFAGVDPQVTTVTQQQ